jgi:hypothetical protein
MAPSLSVTAPSSLSAAATPPPCHALQDYGALIAACVQYGDAASGGEPHLWGDALEYLATQPGDCSGPIAELLRHVEAGNLLPPLVVLQTLAKNPNLKVCRPQASLTQPRSTDLFRHTHRSMCCTMPCAVHGCG